MINEDFILIDSYQYTNEAEGVKKLYDPRPIIVPLGGISLISEETINCYKVNSKGKHEWDTQLRRLTTMYFQEGWGIRTQFLPDSVEEVYKKIRGEI